MPQEKRHPKDIDLVALQSELSQIDFASAPPLDPNYHYRLLRRTEQIRFKMYQELGHMRAHFHVDYGASNHVAAYAVDTGERIAGNLDPKYDKAISAWTRANRNSLLAIWRALQSGEPDTAFIRSMSAFER